MKINFSKVNLNNCLDLLDDFSWREKFKIRTFYKNSKLNNTFDIKYDFEGYCLVSQLNRKYNNKKLRQKKESTDYIWRRILDYWHVE